RAPLSLAPVRRSLDLRAAPGRSATQLDNQLLEEHSRIAGGPFQREVRPEYAPNSGDKVRSREIPKLRSDEPAELSQDLLRRRASLEHQRQLPERIGALPCLDGIRHRPI